MDDPEYTPADDTTSDTAFGATFDNLTMDDLVVDSVGRGFRVADKQLDLIILEEEEGDGLVRLTPQDFDAGGYQHRGEDEPPRG